MTRKQLFGGGGVVLSLVLAGPMAVVWAEEAPPASASAGPSDVWASWLEGDYATGDWGGLRPELDDKGVTVGASAILDWSKNVRGGIDTANSAFRSFLDLNVTLDLGKLVGIEGGTLFVDAYTFNGRSGSERLVGDAQGFDNIDSDRRAQIGEVWYEQKLAGDKLRIKAGKIDANAEFAYANNGCRYLECAFLNSSPGMSPTILGMPTYPDPAMGVVVFVYPVEWLQAGVGVFDGAGQEGHRTGLRGPDTLFGSPADLFFIGELGVLWSLEGETLPGRLGLGGWGHTGTFDRFDGATASGTQGFFVTVAQTLWRENPQDAEDGQGVAAFAQYGWADPQVSEMDHHLGAGVEWTGALPGRDADVAGLMVSWVHFSQAPGAGLVDEGEMVVELVYKARITPWMSLQPDVQYITNPGGAGLADALVFTLRAEVGF